MISWLAEFKQDRSAIINRQPTASIPEDPLDFVELFAGRALLTASLREAGYKGVSIDLEFSRSMDFLSFAGFALALRIELCATILQKGGFESM